MNKPNSSADIIINGRAQVIEILKKLPEEQKNKILDSVVKKNPTLGKELAWQTFAFSSIPLLSDLNLKILLEYLSATVIGLALKNQSVDLQKLLLNSLPTTKAQEVYSYMKGKSARIEDCEKAQKKMVEVALTLLQKKVIQTKHLT